MDPLLVQKLIFIVVQLLCLQLQFSTGEFFSNGTDHNKSDILRPQDVINENNTEGRIREKRNLLSNSLQGTPNSGPGTSVEGLLASCQLTNLLLYQLLQQRQNVGGFSPTGGTGNILQPFAAAGGIINNILAPPRLTTYVSTSTFLTKMTSTAVITIPLLFGNKPSPTTITRTKIYEVTTSEIHTITTTVQPSSTSTITQTITPTLIAPTETSQSYLLSTTTPILDRSSFEEIENDEFQIQHPIQHNPVSRSNSPIEQVIIPDKTSFKKRMKIRKPTAPTSDAPRSGHVGERKILRANPATTENYIGHSYAERTPAYKYGPETYANKRLEQTSREVYYDEPKVAYQQEYNDEEVINQNYYTRRLKRRGEAEPDENPNFEREYLLEPSFDGDESSSFQQMAQCPPPVEITITKTITKFVNPPASILHPSAPTPSSSGARGQKGPSNFQKARRRFEVQRPSPTPSITTEQPSRTQDSPQNVNFEIPKPSPNEQRRSRGDRKYEAPKPQDQTKKEEPVPRRARARGDILQRAIPNTGPSPEYIKFQEENGGFGEVEPGRVRQRSGRIRRPTTASASN